ncbi:DUF3592 domain-containing protein [Streptomyces sp. NPDC057280]|uniref:DUF3592 domain-containing protein n=1 Tax=Streptomyces sp. NPDC057280 TaxID=3346081 RepID=UPI0036285850
MDSGQGRLRRFRWPLVFFVLAAVFAAAPLSVGITQWQRVAEVQGGVRAVGTFHADGANCWRHRCWVEFEAGGKRVEADLPALTETRENKVSRDGEEIVVRYLPSDPTRAAEEDGYGYVGAITAALSLPVVILLIFGVGTLVAVLRGRPPFSPWSSPQPS